MYGLVLARTVHVQALFGLAPSPARMNLVLAVQSSGHGNPIQRLSPLKEESELHGSPAGLVLPSNREYCQCFRNPFGSSLLAQGRLKTLSNYLLS